ncbi:MAG: AAA family ATPase [Candidatus Altiarchaeota archaeon]|nr:AAA family ATPase [Candidatus Altiarchaeota archaeon]
MREEYLDPDFIPEVLPHREGEVGEVFESLKPILDNRRATNLFIHGSAGIGKTAVAKFIIRSFREEGARGIYINCWYQRTEVAVLTEILRQLSYPVPRKGRSVDELVDEFAQNVVGEKLIIILDEVDALTDDSVLYVLSRANIPIGIVMISNEEYAMRHFDSRVKSSLAPSIVTFGRYSVDELFDILKERAKYSFKNFDETAVKVAARLAYKNNSDVRYGLNLLLKAGRIAGKTNSSLNINHVRSVEVIQDPKKEKRETELEGEHKVVIEALRALKNSASSVEVFAKYKEIGGKGAERTFRKYVKELIELQMIKDEDIPGRGKRRRLILRN